MGRKADTVYVCRECGYESPRWMGKCICGAWNSFTEEKLHRDDESSARGRRSAGPAPAVPVRASGIRSDRADRIHTGIGELDRVLGGGLVKGSLVMISGEPGIGKSTLIIQAAAHISKSVGAVLYVSGEESAEQIKMRADRVCEAPLDDLYILAENEMGRIAEAAEKLDPGFLIIDSIQTMYSEEFESAPGSVSQVRAVGNILMNIGKGRGIPVFIVAHVTKSGELAGPKIVEHMVDAVMQFSGERSQDLRILRAVKNRFGTTSEIGAFEMREEGLREIENLSGSFLEGLDDSSEGAVAAAVYEGTRPLLLEIQALTAVTNIGFARRTAIGINSNRLSMIIAVLEKKSGLTLVNRDVYVNIVGGLHPESTTTDLAVAVAVWSAEEGVIISPKTLYIGEIGLTGDLRPVMNAEKLVKEAARMGFSSVVLPKRSAERLLNVPDSIGVIPVTSLADAISTASSQTPHRG